MEDKRIIELFFERSEKAIEESGKKYGGYISAVAFSILASNEDTEEVVNDTYLRAWNSIPPQKPNKLGAFLSTIARNLALDRYASRRKERENIATEAVLDELADCLPDTGGLSAVDEIVLRNAVNSFLGSLTEQYRVVFMRRYWYMMPIAKIAKLSGLGKATVKTILHRTRKQFKKHLEKEGIVI
jgi:RNA polymerase sigma-70 factor (ECF subfamily)